jgi:hypothetical protein
MFQSGYGQCQIKSRARGLAPNPHETKFAAGYKFTGQLNRVVIPGFRKALLRRRRWKGRLVINPYPNSARPF